MDGQCNPREKPAQSFNELNPLVTIPELRKQTLIMFYLWLGKHFQHWLPHLWRLDQEDQLAEELGQLLLERVRALRGDRRRLSFLLQAFPKIRYFSIPRKI